jgi:chemotaxis protein histidine kinase CheA
MIDWKANPELVREFQTETRQKIGELRAFLADHAALADHAMLLRCFSHAHSLKGLAGFMEYHDLEALASAMNEIFRAAKDGKRPLARADLPLLQQALDCCAQLVEGTPPSTYATTLATCQSMTAR